MNHEIDPKVAEAMTALYRKNRQSMMAQGFQDAMPICETFDIAAIKTILDQNPSALRIYYGMNDDAEKSIHAILVGVDSKGNDMFPGQPETGVIIEQGIRCPISCPPASALNQ